MSSGSFKKCYQQIIHLKIIYNVRLNWIWDYAIKLNNLT